jgi:hypothetical protein
MPKLQQTPQTHDRTHNDHPLGTMHLHHPNLAHNTTNPRGKQMKHRYHPRGLMHSSQCEECNQHHQTIHQIHDTELDLMIYLCENCLQETTQ